MTPESPEEYAQQIAKRLVESNFTDQEALDALEAVMAAEDDWEIEDAELSALERRLGLRDDDAEEDSEPGAPVPMPLLPRTPVLAGGNARRLEDSVAESESEK